ncbi:MAG: phosphotransferase family protein [Alphaproteobacteria bacterium]|nr:phosphotransferase family protein [Alphaproteobacteria bacterium]
MDIKYWKNLSNWINSKGLNLELDPMKKKKKNGMGNLNYKIILNNEPFVLRRPPLGPIPPGANDMKREHNVMHALNKKFSLVPNSILLCEDESIFGAPFHIMDFKEGITVNGDKLPDNFRSEKNANYLSKMLIEVLVKLHNINPLDVGLENFGKPIGFLERQLKGWYKRGIIAHYKNASKTMEELYKLLYSSSIPIEEEFVILHNDFKLDNIILQFSTDQNILEPVAIIDWDQATRGHPLFDLATLLSYWTLTEDTFNMQLIKQMPSASSGFMSRIEALNLYQKLSGRNIKDFKWIYALSLLKLGVVFQQLYAQFLRGTIKEDKYKTFNIIAEAAYERGLNALNKNIYI